MDIERQIESACRIIKDQDVVARFAGDNDLFDAGELVELGRLDYQVRAACRVRRFENDLLKVAARIRHESKDVAALGAVDDDPIVVGTAVDLQILRVE